MPGKKFILKVLTAGEGGVGKTTLLRRYVEGKFTADTKMTIGVEFFIKEILVDGKQCMLQLWDFGGQDRFRFLLESYVIGAKGALLAFDLTRMTTIRPLEQWISLLRKYNPVLPILLIGTKADLVDKISVNDDYPLEFKEKFNLFGYMKLSSKEGTNVSEAFETITKKILTP